MKCMCLGIFYLCLFGAYFVVPAIGLIWWFITQPPMGFLQVAIGMAVIWLGLGAGTFLGMWGISKCCKTCE